MMHGLLHIKGRFTSEDARSYQYNHVRMQKKIERYFIPKIAIAIMNQYKSFIDAIRTHGYAYAKANIFLIVKFDGIAKVIKELYKRSAFINANQVIRNINHAKKSLSAKKIGSGRGGAAFGISLEDLAPVIDSYFEIYLLNKSALPITGTTRKYIVTHLVNEVDGGKDLQQAIADFEEIAVTGLLIKSRKRAEKIATTESTRALSFGGLIGAYMSGVDVDKVWVTCHDDAVRGESYRVKFPHTELDLNRASLFGSFYNNEAIRMPGDPNASPGNIMGCRCSLFFEKKSDREREDRDMVNFLIDMRLNEILNK